MTRVLLLLALLIGNVAFAQNTGAVMFLNADMDFSFRDSARYYRVGEMESGLPQGKIQDYYLSGKLFMSGFYTHDYTPDGIFEWYYESGKKKEKGIYENGEYSILHFWDEAGEKTVKKGFGRAVYFYENGSKKCEGYYEKGKKAGLWIYYYRNGAKSELHEYKNGQFTLVSAWDKKGNMTVENGTGTYTSYYLNGRIKAKGNFESGLRTGKWTWNFSNGKTERSGEFENGLETGTHIFYFNSGISRIKLNYKDGLMHGVYIKYHKNGRMDSTCEYKNGAQASSMRRYDEFGNRIPQEDNDDDHSHWQNFNSKIVKSSYF